MNFSKIEDVMYLCRMNLFFYNEEGEFEDWREAEVISIKDNEVTLYNKDLGLYRSYDLDVLEAKCHALCEEHFSALHSFLHSEK